MLDLIKNWVPDNMKIAAKKIYWRLTEPKADFTKEQYKSLEALKCVVSYNKYGGYCVPKSSRHRVAARKIISNDVYEPETIEFMLSNCGNGDIVHAGAYFGDFLPALSEGVTPGSTIWAFEPNIESYRCAKITLEINNIKNVVLSCAGLGMNQEYLPLKTKDIKGRSLGGGSRIIAKNLDEAAEGTMVQIVAIDDVIAPNRNISIIQLDVEDYEEKVLKGALRTIQRCRPIIILEVWPNSTLIASEWFRKNILSLGYHRLKKIHDNTVFICKTKH